MEEATRYLKYFIEYQNIEGIWSILDRMDIKRLQIEKGNKLMILFLKYAISLNRPKSTKYIIKYFSKNTMYPLTGNFSLKAELFTFDDLTDDELTYIVQNLSKMNFSEIIEQFISYERSDKSRNAVFRVLKVFRVSVMDLAAIQNLLELSRDNYKVHELLDRFYHNIAPPAPKPSWMFEDSNFPDVDKMIDYTDVKIPDYDESIQIILDNSSDVLDIGILKEKLQQLKLEEIKLITKSILLTDRGKEIGDNIYLNQFFGPSNPRAGMELGENDFVCSKYGGCRPMYCMCFEIDEDDDEDYSVQEKDWFTSRCDECGIRILKKRYALRRPLSMGGWKGCFCSFDCIDKVFDEPDVLNSSLIELYKQKLEKDKLLDI